MKHSLPRALAICALGLAVIVSFTASVLAQEGTGGIRGTVKDKDTGEALIGANVLVVGTNRGAASNAEGAYQILGLSPGRYAIVARYIGYVQGQRTLTVVANQTVDVNFTLEQDVLRIDEVVVTGLAGDVPRAQLGNSIAKISGSDILSRFFSPRSRLRRGQGNHPSVFMENCQS
jgi:hypothetical protein